MFAVPLVVLVLLKLLLISADEIAAGAESYDATWYLNAAKHWYWGASYDGMAFIRPCAYPLWIAFVHLFGFPLRIAIELLQAAGFLALVAGLRKLGLPRMICVLIFAAMLFHPASLQVNNLVRADTLYAALLSLGLGGLFLSSVTAKTTHALWTGVVFALLWNTREESFLLPIILIAFCALVLGQNHIATKSVRLPRRLTKAFAVMLGALIVVNATIDAANYGKFRVFAKSDMNSPSFKACYKALLRINPNRVQRFVPVSRETLQVAYDVSPTFSRIKPHLDGEIGAFWRQVTFQTLKIENEIAAGWFAWGLRAAAQAAGEHRTPESADRFYRTVAAEVNRACDQGGIPSRRVISSFLDPGAISALSYVPASFYKIVGRFTQRYQISRAREVGDAVITPAQRDLFDGMASRRAATSVVGVMRIIGATFRPNDPVKLVAFRNSNREIVSATDQLISEPDLISHFNLPADSRTDTRFVLRIPLLRTLRPTGDLVFFTKNGGEFSGPASAILAGKPPTANGRSDGEALLCWIRSQKIITPSHAPAFAVQSFIGKYYGLFVVGISWIGLAALIVLLFCARNVRWSDPIYAALAILAITIVLRVALFSFLDATSWPADAPRYSYPIMPLYSGFVLALIYQAWRVASEALRSKTASLNAPRAHNNQT